MLKDPQAYATQLQDCYSLSGWDYAAIDAAQAHRQVPATFFAEVQAEMLLALAKRVGPDQSAVDFCEALLINAKARR